jgi:hypothetical protein
MTDILHELRNSPPEPIDLHDARVETLLHAMTDDIWCACFDPDSPAWLDDPLHKLAIDHGFAYFSSALSAALLERLRMLASDPAIVRMGAPGLFYDGFFNLSHAEQTMLLDKKLVRRRPTYLVMTSLGRALRRWQKELGQP